VPHQKADTAVCEGIIRQAIDHFTIDVADDGLTSGCDRNVVFSSLFDWEVDDIKFGHTRHACLFLADGDRAPSG
jgi:hypothetical protein